MNKEERLRKIKELREAKMKEASKDTKQVGEVAKEVTKQVIKKVQTTQKVVKKNVESSKVLPKFFPQEFIDANKQRIKHLYNFFRSQYDKNGYWKEKEVQTATIIATLLNLSPIAGEVAFIRRTFQRDGKWKHAINVIPTYRGFLKILKNEKLIKRMSYEFVHFGDNINLETYKVVKNPYVRRIPETLQGILLEAELFDGRKIHEFVSIDLLEHRRLMNEAEKQGKHSAWKVDYLMMALAKALKYFVKKLFLELPYNEQLNNLDRFSDVNVLLNDNNDGFEFF